MVISVGGGGHQEQHGHQQPQKRRGFVRRQADRCNNACTCTPDCGDCLPFMTLAMLLRLMSVRTPHRPARSGPTPLTVPTLPARAGLAAIRGYRRWIGPRLPITCPHTPSCSAYGLTAVDRYGLLTGSRLIAGRLTRCTGRVAPGTVDPVP